MPSRVFVLPLPAMRVVLRTYERCALRKPELRRKDEDSPAYVDVKLIALHGAFMLL